METHNLKYQAAFFVDALDIKPKPDTLTYLIEKFADKELIPGTFQEVSPSGVLERFNLKDSLGVWNLEFSSNRIDFVKINSNVNVTEMGSIEDFKKEVINCIDAIFTKFPRKANRLAFVTTYFIPNLNHSRFDEIFNKLFKPIPTHHNNRTEWSSRVVSRVDKKFNDKSELINFITEISRLKGNINIDSTVKSLERLQVKLDLNTYQGNGDYRFESEGMIAYFNEVVKWEHLIREELNKVFNINK